MKPVDERVDPLKRLIKDHEEVSEYVENLEEILGFLHEKEAWDKIRPIENFFKRNVISHFAFEEKNSFSCYLVRGGHPRIHKIDSGITKGTRAHIERIRRVPEDNL